MAVSTKTQLTLKGSTEIVAEFFHYSINSILYQRGIYPPEEFNRESKYGLAMMVSTDEKLRDYMRKVLNDLEGWLLKGEIQQLVVVINGIDSGETLERWVFQVEQARDKENGGLVQQQTSKSKKEISGEISALLRQITATVTFLPMLDEQCAFDILIYTNKDTVVPVQWQESDAQMVKNAAEVRLRSFDTKIHKVETAVAYRELCDDDI